MAPAIGRPALDNGSCGSIPGDWVALPPQNIQMEGIPIQTFHQNPESGSVPLEDLDQCASAIAEREHTAGVRVEVEFQFDDRG